jgi:RNA polymerase sigma-70 factor, ECF subfamily
MILRNQYYSERRRSWRQRPWSQSDAESIQTAHDAQGHKLNLTDLSRAMRLLSDEQRESLILVGAGGFSYEEAASICACAVGTIKSRVARGRATLQQVLEGKSDQTLGTRQDRGDAVDEILGELDQLAPRGLQRQA